MRVGNACVRGGGEGDEEGYERGEDREGDEDKDKREVRAEGAEKEEKECSHEEGCLGVECRSATIVVVDSTRRVQEGREEIKRCACSQRKACADLDAFDDGDGDGVREPVEQAG